MPKISAALPDDLVRAHLSDREKLSDDLWLIPPQLGMLLGRSIEQLAEDRQIGNPPPAMKPWGEKGPVRYRLGTVRDFMLGPAAEEYQNAAHAKKGLAKRATMGLGFVSFHDWIDGALPDDEWPFLLRKLKPPIDFFKSLGLGDALSDSDECATLHLDKYLALRSEAAAYAFAQEEAQIFGEASGHTSAASRKRRMVD